MISEFDDFMTLLYPVLYYLLFSLIYFWVNNLFFLVISVGIDAHFFMLIIKQQKWDLKQFFIFLLFTVKLLNIPTWKK